MTNEFLKNLSSPSNDLSSQIHKFYKTVQFLIYKFKKSEPSTIEERNEWIIVINN